MKITKDLSIDTETFASQGNAILGIKGSGKSYTATYLAEKLFDEGIPFIAIDPIGVWKYLKIGKTGKGYPIVVVGDDGDLPLNPESVSNIVEAAMKENVSIVIDLFSIHLSKAEWKRIVESTIHLLLYENRKYGLRHLFIEEAAEFCPQKLNQGDYKVFAEVEKLARMGGNSSLGYTLINQRSEDVNKSVLELCDCLFLHRQKGKNSLISLEKWLSVADAGNSKEIMKSLPLLDPGECYAWVGGSNDPLRIKIPEKNTFHPDRKKPDLKEFGAKREITADVRPFIDKLNKRLKEKEQKPLHIEKSDKSTDKSRFSSENKEQEKDLLDALDKINNYELAILDMQKKLDDERKLRADAENKLKVMRELLKPRYKELQEQLQFYDRLFGETTLTGESSIDASKYDIWFEKLIGKQKDMLRYMIERKRLTRVQLALLVGMTSKGGSFGQYIKILKSVGLIKEEGNELILQEIE